MCLKTRMCVLAFEYEFVMGWRFNGDIGRGRDLATSPIGAIPLGAGGAAGVDPGF